MKKIYISDYTLRTRTEGETPLSFKEKIEIARNLDKMHVDVIELAPIENEKTDVLLARTILPFLKHSTLAVPVGNDEASVEIAYSAISGAENTRLQVRIPTSPVQMEYFCHRKPAAVLELVKTLILNEVNVKEAEFISETAGLITKKIRPNFKTLGKIYGKQMKEIAAAFGGLSQEVISAIQASEASGTGYVLNLPSGDVTLNAGDYEISSEDMPGWLVATEGSMTIALDVTITEALKQEGVARELINRIQNLRKTSGFDVTDKIDIVIYADGADGADIAASLENFSGYVAAQTLALSISSASLAEAGDAPEVEWNEGSIRIQVTKKQ